MAATKSEIELWFALEIAARRLCMSQHGGDRRPRNHGVIAASWPVSRVTPDPAITAYLAALPRAPDPAGDEVERVARALHNLWCPTCDPYEHSDDAHRAYCERSARAAIAAMRTPPAQDPQP